MKIKGSYLSDDESGEAIMQVCQPGVDDGGSKDVICFVNGMAIADIRSIKSGRYYIIEDEPGIAFTLRVLQDQESGECDEEIIISLQDVVDVSSLRNLVSKDQLL
jgi:hypothetical protein